VFLINAAEYTLPLDNKYYVIIFRKGEMESNVKSFRCTAYVWFVPKGLIHVFIGDVRSNSKSPNVDQGSWKQQKKIAVRIKKIVPSFITSRISLRRCYSKFAK